MPEYVADTLVIAVLISLVYALGLVVGMALGREQREDEMDPGEKDALDFFKGVKRG